MEDALLDNPERVEKVLRQQGVELADDDGDEDFSSSRMTRFIRTIRRDSTTKLNRWVPARQAELRTMLKHPTFGGQESGLIELPNANTADLGL
jgi:hypothetical protein